MGLLNHPSVRVAALPLTFVMLALFSTASVCAQIPFDKNLLRKDDAWFRSEEAEGVANSVIQYQSPHGGWPQFWPLRKGYYSHIKAGVEWFDSVKIEGYRYRRSETQRALTKDPQAAPLWARFYAIKSNRPIFSDRDGVVKYDIQEIGGERRGGYTWYGNWGEKVAKGFTKWPYREAE